VREGDDNSIAGAATVSDRGTSGSRCMTFLASLIQHVATNCRVADTVGDPTKDADVSLANAACVRRTRGSAC